MKEKRLYLEMNEHMKLNKSRNISNQYRYIPFEKQTSYVIIYLSF